MIIVEMCLLCARSVSFYEHEKLNYIRPKDMIAFPSGIVLCIAE
jgi:hypothetical protein